MELLCLEPAPIKHAIFAGSAWLHVFMFILSFNQSRTSFFIERDWEVFSFEFFLFSFTGALNTIELSVTNWSSCESVC